MNNSIDRALTDATELRPGVGRDRAQRDQTKVPFTESRTLPKSNDDGTGSRLVLTPAIGHRSLSREAFRYGKLNS